MVDYIYSDYFYDHESSHIVIVNSDATVTGVAMSAPTITGARYVITEVDIPQEKFDLEESLCSEDNLTFGLLEASRLWFTMYHYDDGEDVPDLTDEEVAVYIYFNGNSSNIFRVGTFIVKEDKYGADRSKREVNSYDVLNDLRDFDISKWYSAVYKDNPLPTVKELRDSLFTWLTTPKSTQYLGIPGGNYGYTLIQEDVDLVNDDFEVEQGIESDTITFGFFMQGLLEVNGVFAHVDRQGIIRYKQLESYDTQAVKVFGENLRIPPLNYPDYHVWGIGYVRAIDKNNMEIARMGSSAYEHPSIYNIVDNFVFSNTSNRNGFDEQIKAALQNARDVMTHLWYYPFDTKCIGNLTYEVGDRIDIERAIYNDGGGISGYETFYTYILERHFSGINGFKDTMSAKGDRKQPKYKISKNSNWHKGDSADNSVDGNDGTGEVVDDSATKFIKYCRNIGIRLLLEPSQVSVKYVKELGNHHVELKWKDPNDITTYRPVPCDWAGTIVVRSDSHVPVHPWDDCEILVDSTTRDAYLEEPFVDNTIEVNKKYYYGIFPYHIALDDADHPIKYYRFTKVISVNTQRLSLAPLIVSHTVSGSDVTLTIEIPTLDDGSYSYVKAVAKKNSIPASKTDGTVIDLSATATSVTFSGLDEQSHYYFVIFANDGGASDIASDPDDCTTGRNEGYNFAYTGSIQTFTAPKTGIYQLETWGAQGGNAEDSENELTARGGYGAYAKGEILLIQGETLYIGVGGQNGYNGGGTQPQNMLRVMFEGSPTYLAQISDQSIITSEIKNATSFTRIRPSFYDASEQLSYLSSNGDIFYEQNRDLVFSEENTYKLVDNDYIEVGFGKVPYLYSGRQYYGAYVYNKVAQTFGNVYGFERNVSELYWTRKYYVAVVIDHVYKRAYMLFGNDTRNFNYSANGWLCDLYGGVVNGVDYIYESFKDREV